MKKSFNRSPQDKNKLPDLGSEVCQLMHHKSSKFLDGADVSKNEEDDLVKVKIGLKINENKMADLIGSDGKLPKVKQILNDQTYILNEKKHSFQDKKIEFTNQSMSSSSGFKTTLPAKKATDEQKKQAIKHTENNGDIWKVEHKVMVQAADLQRILKSKRVSDNGQLVVGKKMQVQQVRSKIKSTRDKITDASQYIKKSVDGKEVIKVPQAIMNHQKYFTSLSTPRKMTNLKKPFFLKKTEQSDPELNR